MRLTSIYYSLLNQQIWQRRFIIKESRQVFNFNGITLNGPGKLTIIMGDTESLSIEAEECVLPRIRTEVVGKMLFLGLEQENFSDRIRPEKEINYYLTISNLESIILSGSGSITSSHLDVENLKISICGSGNMELGNLSVREMFIKVSGSGCIRIISNKCSKAGVKISGSGEAVITSLSAEMLTTKISGSACVALEGDVAQQKIEISGSGEYHAVDLVSNTALIDISGSGKAIIRAEKQIDANIDGSGEVCFYGESVIIENISGSGRMVAMEDV